MAPGVHRDGARPPAVTRGDARAHARTRAVVMVAGEQAADAEFGDARRRPAPGQQREGAGMSAGLDGQLVRARQLARVLGRQGAQVDGGAQRLVGAAAGGEERTAQGVRGTEARGEVRVQVARAQPLFEGAQTAVVRPLAPAVQPADPAGERGAEPRAAPPALHLAPRLAAYESQRPAGTGPVAYEREWAHAEQLRADLAAVREALLSLAVTLQGVAGVGVGVGDLIRLEAPLPPQAPPPSAES
ncbi:hypothetical protein [Streptomyces sp. NPDC048172]|uniref:hypothetical protein n=1 Tax=Streptomyces sp. NPDC048172 TaxID=3365505 RepID=UPI00371A5B21